ncbi:MAG: T9SS type A sorting domain-containing protein [Opitutaceae bacterium]|nr:T9SS type A sorting domain-containing protein [Cytophagales bacterium]
MKKVLLSILTLCAGLTSHAQIENGYFPERGYAMDFVTDAQNVNKVYWWNQDNPNDTTVTVRVDRLIDVFNDICTTYRAPFVYNWVRVPMSGTDLHSGYVSYTLNQTYGNYEPVGVGFGEGNTLDISHNNAYLGFKFKNTSATTIVLQVGLQDINKHIINSMAVNTATGVKPNTVVTEAYKEQISFTLDAGASVDTVLDFNESRYPSYTPYYPEYKKDDCNRSLSSTTNVPNPTKIRNFDYTKLYAVTFTVVNEKVLYPYPGGEDGYKPDVLNNASFQISKFRVGIQNALGLNDDDQSSNTKVLSVYPNPVNNGILNLSAIAQNIKVLDVLGNVMMTSSSAKELNVSSLNKGVYTLQCSKGTSRFVVE